MIDTSRRREDSPRSIAALGSSEVYNALAPSNPGQVVPTRGFHLAKGWADLTIRHGSHAAAIIAWLSGVDGRRMEPPLHGANISYPRAIWNFCSKPKPTKFAFGRRGKPEAMARICRRCVADWKDRHEILNMESRLMRSKSSRRERLWRQFFFRFAVQFLRKQIAD